MRIKLAFPDPSQPARLQAALVSAGHVAGEDFLVERGTERFLELMIQPNLFREISDLVKRDREGYAGVSIEIEDQQIASGSGKAEEEDAE